MKKLFNKKTVIFHVLMWFICLLGIYTINTVAGIYAGNRYIALDPINKKISKTTWGYFAPNQKKIILFPGCKEYQVTVNSLGFRSVGPGGDIPIEEMQNKYRILAIGDSMTFGLFNNDEESYPYQLQQLLLKNGKNAVVLNAGIGSSTITDFLYYLQKKGLDLKPDMVVIGFCKNDFNEMEELPAYQRMIEDSAFDFAKSVKLTKFFRAFRQVTVQGKYRHWLGKIEDEKVKRILEEKSIRLSDVLYVQAYEGGKIAEDPLNSALRDQWKKYLNKLDETISLLKENKIDVLFIIFPDILDVFDSTKSNVNDMLVPFLKKRDVEYIDMVPLFKARKNEYYKLYNDLPRDFHLSGEGNKVLVNEFYSRIKGRIK